MKELIENLFDEYKKSVYDLADKLPQWNSKDYMRRLNSAIASLFEEAGEISGLISKYRIRKDYWKRDLNENEFEEIRNKFIDEVSDFLWVLVCSCHSLGWKGNIKDELLKDNSYATIKHNYFERSLYNLFSDIYNLSSLPTTDIKPILSDIVFDFKVFLIYLKHEYDITLEDLILFNMNKLEKRYDSNGKRVDEEGEKF